MIFKITLLKKFTAISFSREARIVYPLLIVLSFIPYLNSLGNGFVWDDAPLIVGNEAIRNWGKLPFLIKSEDAALTATGFYRPLTKISFLIDYSLWGLNPFGYHMINLLLHVAVVLLIYLNFKDLYSPKTTFIAALFFAFHPVLTEAVNFLSGGRNTLLSAVFMLSAFLLYQRFRKSGKMTYFALTLLAFFLSALAKEFAFMLPFILIAYEFSHADERPTFKKGAMIIFSFAGVVIMYIMLKLWAIGTLVYVGPQELPIGDRLTHIPGVFFDYFTLLLFPLRLHLYYDENLPQTIYNFKSLTGVIFLAGTLFFLIWTARHNKGIFFCILWLGVSVVPSLNIIPKGGTPVALRHLYISAIGYALLFSIFLDWLGTRMQRRMPGLFVLILMIFFLISTIYRNLDWKDNYTLFSKELKINPDSGRAIVHVAAWHIRERRFAEAEAILTKAYKNYIYPGEALHMLGDLYLNHMKDAVKALEYYKEAIAFGKHENDYPLYQDYNTLGKVYEQAGNYQAAEEAYHKAVELNPSYSPAYTDMGILFFKQGKFSLSAEHLRKAISINRYDEYAHNALGATLRAMRQYDLAAAEFRKAIELSPGFCEAHYNLGLVMELPAYGQARDVWQRYIEVCGEVASEREFVEKVKKNYYQSLKKFPILRQGYRKLKE